MISRGKKVNISYLKWFHFYQEQLEAKWKWLKHLLFLPTLDLGLVLDFDDSGWLDLSGLEAFCRLDPWATSHDTCCQGPVSCSPLSFCTGGVQTGQMSPYPQSLLGKYLKSHLTLRNAKKKKSYFYMKHFVIIPRGSSQELIAKIISLFVL